MPQALISICFSLFISISLTSSSLSLENFWKIFCSSKPFSSEEKHIYIAADSFGYDLRNEMKTMLSCDVINSSASSLLHRKKIRSFVSVEGNVKDGLKYELKICSSPIKSYHLRFSHANVPNTNCIPCRSYLLGEKLSSRNVQSPLQCAVSNSIFTMFMFARQCCSRTYGVVPRRHTVRWMVYASNHQPINHDKWATFGIYYLLKMIMASPIYLHYAMSIAYCSVFSVHL